MPIVEGVGSSASVRGDAKTSKRVEEAMAASITKAYAEGITDPDIIRERQLAARDAVLKELRGG